MPVKSVVEVFSKHFICFNGINYIFISILIWFKCNTAYHSSESYIISKNTNLNIKNKNICAPPIMPKIRYDFFYIDSRYSIRFKIKKAVELTIP